MEPHELERWGSDLVAAAAASVRGEIPASQEPTIGSLGRARTAGAGYVARYVHFRRADYPAQLCVWLFVVPPRHAYNFAGDQTRAGAGLMRNPDTELAESALTAGLTGVRRFRWRVHNNRGYAGWRLAIDVSPDDTAPEAAAAALAAEVLVGLRSTRLLAATT